MSHEPIYRQIMNRIENMIESGDLAYGAKLPTERDLASELGVSRGTVKKAFAELEKAGVISIVWGSGAYVLKKQSTKEGPERELGEAFFGMLADIGYAPKEAWEYAEIKYSQAFRLGNVRIGIISTCPECLIVFSKQLASLKDPKISTYLMDDLLKFREPSLIFKEFDIILSANDCFDTVLGLLPEIEPSLLKLSTAPSKETQIDLIKIMNFEKSGLLVASREFRDIVNDYIDTKGARYGEKDYILDKWTDRDRFDEFVADKRHLVIPPLYSLELEPEVYEGIFEFLRGGGDIVTFNYMIERSSLLHIEERVMKILYKSVEAQERKEQQ